MERTYGSGAIGSPIVPAGAGCLIAGNSAAIIGTTGAVIGNAEPVTSRGRGAPAPPRASSPSERLAIRVGLISDTHGLLRPEARAFLDGADRILHAGDIGDRSVLDELRALAPLVAVRGNNDLQAWGARLPATRTLRIGGVGIYLLHDRAELRERAPPSKVRVIVTGHSHRPLIEKRDGVLFVNPGSAGPRRFKLPVAAGEIEIRTDRVRARIVDLLTGRPLPGLSATLAI
jgi:uncharacterized protein